MMDKDRRADLARRDKENQAKMWSALDEKQEQMRTRVLLNLNKPKNKKKKVMSREAKAISELVLAPFGQNVIVTFEGKTTTEKETSLILSAEGQKGLVVPVWRIVGYGSETEEIELNKLVVLASMPTGMYEVFKTDVGAKGFERSGFLIRESQILGYVEEENLRNMNSDELKSFVE